jgi:oligoribonuclease
MSEKENNLSPVMVWLDFETTGVRDHDILLEVSLIVTDNDLNELGEYTSLIIDASPDDLIPEGQARTKDSQITCWEKHWETGLIDELKAACDADELLPTLSEVEAHMTSLLNAHGVHEAVPRRERPPLCGSSVGFDRRFLRKYMPDVNALLHYRNIDVSTVLELQKRWRPDFPKSAKSEAHRTLQDVRESIGHLRNFRDNGFIG